MKKAKHLIILSFFLFNCQSMMRNMNMIPMGSSIDQKDARVLWKAMKREKLVGANSKKVKPIIGAAPPHGWVLEIMHQKLTVNNYTGFLVLKKNYNGSPNPTISQVEENRNKYLSSITIMFQREKGYDQENLNWFWAKYKPNGSLFYKSKMMMQIALAGRIAKGKKQGCIACHSSAGGGDYIFYPEITIPKN